MGCLERTFSRRRAASQNALPRADDIGATAMQIFTKQPNRWMENDVSPDDAKTFKAALAKSGVQFTNAHDSYLINLASPDPALRAKSVESFRRELQRCHSLGLDALVSHPGNFMDDRDSGIDRNADAITESLEHEHGTTRLLMELTAGQGTVIGSTFEEMALLLSKIPAKLRKRVGVCLDTAHIFAAGHDLITDYDGVWARFDDIIGLDCARTDSPQRFEGAARLKKGSSRAHRRRTYRRETVRAHHAGSAARSCAEGARDAEG